MALTIDFTKVLELDTNTNITIGVKSPSAVTTFDIVLMDVYLTHFNVEAVLRMTPAAANIQFMT